MSMPWRLIAMAAIMALSPVRSSAQPSDAITIHAEDSLEWQRDTRRYIARGNAQAVDGDVTVHADTLIAYYGEGDSGEDSAAIENLEARGRVRVVTPHYRASGGEGAYDPKQGRLVLTRNPLMFEAPEEGLVVTAVERIEYSQRDRVGLARGEAVAVRGDRSLQADVLTAYFVTDGAPSLDRIEARGNVVVMTEKGRMSGRRGVYDMTGNTAIITEDVVMAFDGNTLYGQRGVVDMNTGVGRLLGTASKELPKSRVRAIIPLERKPPPEKQPR